MKNSINRFQSVKYLIPSSRLLLTRFFTSLGKVPLWIIPLLISLLLALPTTSIYLTSDGAYYANTGIYLSRGYGLIDSDLTPITMRPLLPFILSVVFSSFGSTPLAAQLTVRFFYILTPITMFFLGKKLYNEPTGLIASILLLTSFNISDWSTQIHIDFIMPFFILQYMFSLIVALKKSNIAWYILPGVLLGIAFLVKEVSIIFIALPFMIWLLVKQYRTTKTLLGLVILLFSCILLITPWLIYVYSKTHQIELLFGEAFHDAISLILGHKQSAPASPQSLISLIQTLLSSFVSFYKNILQSNFVIAPLFIISIVFTFVSALLKSEPHIIALLAIVNCLPMIVFQGTVGFRPTQSIILFELLYLILGATLVLALIYFYKAKFKNHYVLEPVIRFSPTIFIIAILAVQVLSDNNGNLYQYAKEYNTIEALGNGLGNLEVKFEEKGVLASWLSANLSAGDRIMGYVHNYRPINFLSDGHFFFYNYPFSTSIELSDSYSDNVQQNAIFIDLDQFGNQFEQDITLSNMTGLTEKKLLSYIQENQIDYILVGGVYRWLAVYFLNNPGFVKIADFGFSETHIFKVIGPLQQIYPKLIVGKNVPEYLRTLEEKNPAKYNYMIQNYLKNELDMTDIAINQITADIVSTADLTESISLGNYVKYTEDILSIEKAIITQEIVLENNPTNPWANLQLGRLLVEKGDLPNGIKYYRNAINNTDDPDYLVQIIDLNINKELLPLYLVMGNDYPFIRSIENIQEKEFYPQYNFIDELQYSNKNYDNSFQDIRKSVFIINGVPRRVIIQHPTSEITYRLKLPNGPSYLQFGTTLAPEVWNEIESDGVDFSIYLNSQKLIFYSFVNPFENLSQKDWNDQTINLSPWAGQTVTMTFKTEPGPYGDTAFDWAGWVEPRIVVPVTYDLLDNLAFAEISTEEPDLVFADNMKIQGEQRSILYEHPNSLVTYSVYIPQQAVLAFGIGMDPKIWEPEYGDGVEFSVYVELPEQPNIWKRIFYRYYDPKNNLSDRAWIDTQVDLSAFEGKIVNLIFGTSSGPTGNNNFDWAAWSHPILMSGSVSLDKQLHQHTFSLDSVGH